MKYAHFIGCGGAGVFPLMVIFHQAGYVCSGSDLIENANTLKLQQLGMLVFQGHSAGNLPMEANAENAIVIFTSAAGKNNPELQEAERRGIKKMRRGDALAHIASHFEYSIGIAGSHGKTTVTAMIVHSLIELGYEPGFMIGGNVKGHALSGSYGKGKLFVTELDESDSTNALFSGNLAVITNVEDDHSWSVGGAEKLYASFVDMAKKAQHIIYPDKTFETMLFSQFKDKSTSVEIRQLTDCPVIWQGTFLEHNALFALAALKKILPDMAEQKIKEALYTFQGVERRLTLRLQNEKFKLVEDYAHHPTELRFSLRSIRKLYPRKQLVVIFQPHRFARLERYLNDFADILSMADKVYIVPVFAAWLDKSGVNSETLAGLIPNAESVCGEWSEIADFIFPEITENDIVAVIGAGDVNALISEFAKKINFKKEM